VPAEFSFEYHWQTLGTPPRPPDSPSPSSRTRLLGFALLVPGSRPSTVMVTPTRTLRPGLGAGRGLRRVIIFPNQVCAAAAAVMLVVVLCGGFGSFPSAVALPTPSISPSASACVNPSVRPGCGRSDLDCEEPPTAAQRVPTVTNPREVVWEPASLYGFGSDYDFVSAMEFCDNPVSCL
jgi:hypothetical protein